MCDCTKNRPNNITVTHGAPSARRGQMMFVAAEKIGEVIAFTPQLLPEGYDYHWVVTALTELGRTLGGTHAVP